MRRFCTNTTSPPRTTTTPTAGAAFFSLLRLRVLPDAKENRTYTYRQTAGAFVRFEEVILRLRRPAPSHLKHSVAPLCAAMACLMVSSFAWCLVSCGGRVGVARSLARSVSRSPGKILKRPEIMLVLVRLQRCRGEEETGWGTVEWVETKGAADS